MKLCRLCNKPAQVRGYCETHARIQEPRRIQRRKYPGGKRRNPHPLENDANWKLLSKSFLSDNLLCVRCSKMNRVQPASEVDHIKPARKYPKLVYDRNNLQALCRRCHRIKTSRYERRGEYPDYARGVIYYDS